MKIRFALIFPLLLLIGDSLTGRTSGRSSGRSRTGGSYRQGNGRSRGSSLSSSSYGRGFSRSRSSLGSTNGQRGSVGSPNGQKGTVGRSSMGPKFIGGGSTGAVSSGSSPGSRGHKTSSFLGSMGTATGTRNSGGGRKPVMPRGSSQGTSLYSSQRNSQPNSALGTSPTKRRVGVNVKSPNFSARISSGISSSLKGSKSQRGVLAPPGNQGAAGPNFLGTSSTAGKSRNLPGGRSGSTRRTPASKRHSPIKSAILCRKKRTTGGTGPGCSPSSAASSSKAAPSSSAPSSSSAALAPGTTHIADTPNHMKTYATDPSLNTIVTKKFHGSHVVPDNHKDTVLARHGKVGKSKPNQVTAQVDGKPPRMNTFLTADTVKDIMKPGGHKVLGTQTFNGKTQTVLRSKQVVPVIESYVAGPKGAPKGNMKYFEKKRRFTVLSDAVGDKKVHHLFGTVTEQQKLKRKKSVKSQGKAPSVSNVDFYTQRAEKNFQKKNTRLQALISAGIPTSSSGAASSGSPPSGSAPSGSASSGSPPSGSAPSGSAPSGSAPPGSGSMPPGPAPAL